MTKPSRGHNENDDERWAHARELPLEAISPMACGAPDALGNGAENRNVVTVNSGAVSDGMGAGAVLQVTGWESPARTLFARIALPGRARGEPTDDAREDAKELRNGIQPVNSSQYCRCWRVEDVLAVILGELSSPTHEATKAIAADAAAPAAAPADAASCATRPSPETLLELGAVWVLDPRAVDRPQNQPRWKRLSREPVSPEHGHRPRSVPNDGAATALWFAPEMTLRIHSRPSRYPVAHRFRQALERQQSQQEPTERAGSSSSSNASSRGSHDNMACGSIVYEHVFDPNDPDSTSTNPGATTLGFAVLDKPGGLPSHPTVDNARENLLAVYRRHRRLAYASLPQRLDTETSGLILVAAHPRYARHLAGLLERKTQEAAAAAAAAADTDAADAAADATTRDDQAGSGSIPSIHKRYRCLVTFPGSPEATREFLKTHCVDPGRIVEHYVDARSKAPKSFVDAETFRSNTPTGAAESSAKWQLCRLRIVALRFPVRLHPSVAEGASAGTELEVELVTGRTHQIRGQLAALGCPLWGDPIYGPDSPKEWSPERSGAGMALQCCGLDLATAVVPGHGKTIPRKRAPGESFAAGAHETGALPAARTDQKRFALGSAWWRDTRSTPP